MENVVNNEQRGLRLVYTLRLAEYLVSRGFLKFLKRVEKDRRNDKRNVYLFYDGPGLSEAIDEYVQAKRVNRVQ